jgi:hypothetical protein
MTKKERANDWVNWFRLAVTQARDAVDAERKQHLESVVNQYRAERPTLISKEQMDAVESEARNS